MRKMGLNKNYVVAIYDDPEFSSRHLSVQQKRKEITEFFTRFKYFGPIVVGRNINEVLDKALEHEVDYCIVQSVGHIPREGEFFRLLENWMESKNFFVTGHIMDKETVNSQSEGGGYYGLHKQCMVVNLNYYKKFDKPVFGDKTSEDTFVVRAKRHVRDIHDDYTPLSLMPTDELAVCTPNVAGWNFISKSLENDLTVYNFHPKIREFKEFIYPSSSIDDLQRQLSWINNIVTYAPQCVFLWNTETYLDLKYCELDKPIKNLYTLAASFKPHMILNKFGFTEDAVVNYYDYSKPALSFQKDDVRKMGWRRLSAVHQMGKAEVQF